MNAAQRRQIDAEITAIRHKHHKAAMFQATIVLAAILVASGTACLYTAEHHWSMDGRATLLFAIVFGILGTWWLIRWIIGARPLASNGLSTAPTASEQRYDPRYLRL